MSCPFTLNPVSYLKCPYSMSIFIVAVSCVAIGLAYIAQYVFGLQPCVLCIYQRIPFYITIAIGIISFYFSIKKRYGISAFLIALSGITFLFNSGLAFFHTGVEQKWWKGFSGCSAPDFSKMTPAEMAEAIRNMPTVFCDKIAWEMFGLSMANYNVIVCLGLGIICLSSAFIIRKRLKSGI